MVQCPDCGNQMRERGPNFFRNLRRRKIEDVRDKFVCENCMETWSKDEVATWRDDQTNLREWMEEEA